MWRVVRMKKIILILLFVLLVPHIAYAYGEEDFAQAEEIIMQKTQCSQLTNKQLELIGDYYMGQIHPGEAHEVMDEMMGGEGSESLRLMHIAMAKRLYCDDFSGMAQYGMMGMMGYPTNGQYGEMMSGFGPFGWHWGFGFVINLLFWVLIIWLIVWVIMKYKKPKQSPIDILKVRYAKGEISKKQFEQMKKKLR
jgi:uncharacterized membrane protein